MRVRESYSRFDADRNAGRHFVPPFVSDCAPSPFERAIRDVWGEPRWVAGEAIRQVLIVGDSPGVCSALCEALDHPRLRVRTTDSPARAFASLARERTDFVIAESRLRLASGIDFLEVVRDEFPHVSRVLLTGDRDVAAIREAVRRCGIAFFLPKPWDAGTISELVERLLLADGWDGAPWDALEANARTGSRCAEVGGSNDQRGRSAALPPEVQVEEE